MPSRAERRRRGELALRVAAVVTVGWLVWGAFAPPPPPAGRTPARGAPLEEVLPGWSLRPPAETLHVVFDRAPTPAERDWLASLGRVGHAVAWSHTGITAAALVAERLPDPGGRVELRVSAPSRTSVTVADELGRLDSALVRHSGAVFAVPQPVGDVTVQVGDQPLRVYPGDRLAERAAVIVAAAGWEAKFAMAALEERGWQVHARLAVAPGIDVIQGTPFPLDTLRHAVVLALDSSAARSAAAIGAFVVRGGGLVLTPGAARAPQFRSLAAGAVASPVTVVPSPLPAPSLASIDPLAETSFVLERHDGLVVVAGRRVGAGRVVQVGYEDTWRWRMQGDDQAPESHRVWWGRVIAAAAYRGNGADETVATGDAPFAKLVGVLGPPISMPTASSGARLSWYPLVLAMLVALLLGEWASRRLRGAA